MNICTAARLTRVKMGERFGAWGQGPLSFDHVDDMLKRIETGEIKGEKAHRWLGWAQCAAVAAGTATLDDMKAINHAA